MNQCCPRKLLNTPGHLCPSHIYPRPLETPDSDPAPIPKSAFHSAPSRVTSRETHQTRSHHLWQAIMSPLRQQYAKQNMNHSMKCQRIGPPHKQGTYHSLLFKSGTQFSVLIFPDCFGEIKIVTHVQSLPPTHCLHVLPSTSWVHSPGHRAEPLPPPFYPSGEALPAPSHLPR